MPSNVNKMPDVCIENGTDKETEIFNGEPNSHRDSVVVSLRVERC